MAGPNVQDDLFDIVQRFWLHKIVMTADIAKMYRQVWVNAEDRSLQRILWRKTPDKPITTYELHTNTYGLTSAPFLATRCLQQLIENEALNNPEAAQMAGNGFCVDDLITGTDDVDTALTLQQELIEMLKKRWLYLEKVGIKSSSTIAAFVT